MLRYADATIVTASLASPAVPRLTADIHGAEAVAEAFKETTRGAQLVLLDGEPSTLWAPGGKPRMAFGFVFETERIVEISVIASPDTLALLDLDIRQPRA